MSAKENKIVVLRFINEAYNRRNLTVGDESLAANVVLHIPYADIEGLEGWKQYAGSFLTGFTDIVVHVKDTIAEGDKVVAHWTCGGVHTGELQGICPNRQASYMDRNRHLPLCRGQDRGNMGMERFIGHDATARSCFPCVRTGSILIK
jgi:predicted ester cyclase